MKRLYAFLLLLANYPAAQGATVTSWPDTSVSTSVDTVAAIHRLFAAKRKTSTYLIGGTVLAAGAGALIALNQPARNTGSGGGFNAGIDGRPIVAALIGVLSLPVLTVELLHRGNWNQRSEQWAIDTFEAHRLPRSLRRKLKPIYFQP